MQPGTKEIHNGAVFCQSCERSIGQGFQEQTGHLSAWDGVRGAALGSSEVPSSPRIPWLHELSISGTATMWRQGFSITKGRQIEAACCPARDVLLDLTPKWRLGKVMMSKLTLPTLQLKLFSWVYLTAESQNSNGLFESNSKWESTLGWFRQKGWENCGVPFLTVEKTKTKFQERGKECFIHQEPPYSILGISQFNLHLFLTLGTRSINTHPIQWMVIIHQMSKIQFVHIQKENADEKGQRQLKALSYIKTMNLI